MEIARNTIQEYLHNNESVESIDYTDLKVNINNMLFMYLPDHLTIRQMEALSTTIYDIVSNPEDYLLKAVN
jgi:hypothetical protein